MEKRFVLLLGSAHRALSTSCDNPSYYKYLMLSLTANRHLENGEELRHKVYGKAEEHFVIQRLNFLVFFYMGLHRPFDHEAGAQ